MKPSRLLPTLALGALTLSGAGLATAQDGGDDRSDAPALDMQAMMEAMRLAQPGPEHEELAEHLVGDWESEVQLAMPGMPATTQTATATARTILGGRFVEIVSEGDFMGQPFESRLIVGFDRRHGVYTLIGLDTLGTYWVTGRGERGEDGVVRMHGEDDDPMGEQVYTFELELVGQDEHELRTVFHRLGEQVFEEPLTMVTVRSKRKSTE